MTKQEFLSVLREKLSGLPVEDIEEQLIFYSEIIDDRMEESLSEEEAVLAMGSSDEIAAQILSELQNSQTKNNREKQKKSWSVAEIVLIVLGFPLWFPLIIAVFSVALAVYAVIFSAVFSFWAVFAAFVGSSLCVAFSGTVFLFTGNPVSGIAMIGAGIALAGLSIFTFFGCHALTRFIFDFTKKAIIWVKNLFVRKEGAR